MPADVCRSVEPILRNLTDLSTARALFAELNYDPVRASLSRRDWSQTARDALVEDPRIIAAHGEFQVLHARLASERLLPTLERPVVHHLLSQRPYALFLFSTQDQQRWHFVNVKYGEETSRRRLFRRITVGPEERAGNRLRTASERIALLDLESL